jgi:ElaB/YqjD/DUF883 family membrane-anchored ribosome-binding protein
MANEDMIGSSVGKSTAQKKGVHSGEEAWHTAEDLKSASLTMAKDYAEKASAVFDKTKKRVRTFREHVGDFVRRNPMKAAFAALSAGFVLGLTFRYQAWHQRARSAQKARSR